MEGSTVPGFISPVYGQLSRSGVSGTEAMRTVFWEEEKRELKLIDQRALPCEVKFLSCKTVEEVAKAISTMVVRGAPAIGAAGAYGIAIAALTGASTAAPGQAFLQRLEMSKLILDEARPTAVNLSWATSRMVSFARLVVAHSLTSTELDASKLVLKEAANLSYEDIQINCRMAQHGSLVVQENANILHHCNTGALATVDVGTALGVIYESHYQEKNIHVWVDETRPRLQGARLTAWELGQAGVPHHLICDSTAGSLMRKGKIDVVLFGADRVAANGDVVNKIGTYSISVLAKVNNIPVYAVVPTSTIDLSIAKGDDVVIEERSHEEISNVMGKVQIAPTSSPVYNPAFDCTPHDYLTGIITEEGICYPPFSVSLKRAKEVAETRIKTMWNHRVDSLIEEHRKRSMAAASALSALGTNYNP